MSITVHDTTMTSDLTQTVAERISQPGMPEVWTVTGRPGTFTRNQAITAMLVAVHRDTGDTGSPHLAHWERELLVPVLPDNRWALLQTLTLVATAIRNVDAGPAREPADVEEAIRYAEESRELLKALAGAVQDLAGSAQSVYDGVMDRACRIAAAEWVELGLRGKVAADQLMGAAASLRIAEHAGVDVTTELTRQRDARRNGR